MGARRRSEETIMPRITLVRYPTKPERADENEKLSRAVYAALRAEAPAHIAYALFRDGVNFVHLFVNLRDDSSDAVTELPSFKAFTAGLSERCPAPPETMRISPQLVDSYGFASA